MGSATPESGSYRDRRGRIFYVGDRVLRTVMPMAKEDFDFVRASGLIDSLVEQGRLTAETIVDNNILGLEGDAAALVLEHPRLLGRVERLAHRR